MNINKIILGVLLVLIMTISATTATAATEEKADKIDMHASFRNVDENGTITITTIDVVKYYNKTYLFTGQDVRRHNDYPVSFALGIQVLNEEELKIQENLRTITLTVPEVNLNLWYPYHAEMKLTDLEVTWKADEKAKVIHYNQQDPEYPKFKDVSLSCKGVVTESLDGSNLGDCFHSKMDINMSACKVE